jgi:hypothetical protein
MPSGGPAEVLAAPAACFKEIDAGSDNGGDWAAFAKRLRRAYGDAVRLALTRARKQSDEYDMKRLHGRIIDLSIGDGSNMHAL